MGINTDYIGTTDFKMEDYDREFCVQVKMSFLVDLHQLMALDKWSEKPSASNKEVIFGCCNYGFRGGKLISLATYPKNI